MTASLHNIKTAQNLSRLALAPCSDYMLELTLA